jgi:beta-N-acetylhexosaminidase
MTAHVLVREIDDRLPATLSPRLVDELLRKEMKYAGVVVSDDLEMGAVAKHWRAGEAAVLAAQAGCDILPVCKSADAQVEAIEALIRAVEREEITTTALDDADARIRALKERFLLPYRDPDPKEARRVAGLGEHRNRAEEIGSRSGLPARA